MAVAIDIDNVICDTDEVVRWLFRGLYGITASREQITTWEYSSCLPITKEQERHVFDVLHKIYLGAIPPLPGASLALKQMMDDAEVWFVTARPKFCKDATETWLAKHGFDYDVLRFVESKAALESRFAFSVDDNPKAADDLMSVSSMVFLMDRPWNRAVRETGSLKRVRDWSEIRSQGSDLLGTRRNRVGLQTA